MAAHQRGLPKVSQVAVSSAHGQNETNVADDDRKAIDAYGHPLAICRQ
jgi:hypothetical protein